MTTKFPCNQSYKHNVLADAEAVASTSIRGGDYTTDLYASWKTLYRTKNGKFIVALQGGAAIANTMSRVISRDEAVDWVATVASDPVTGYGYSREQAEIIVDGGDAGKGYRDND